MGRRRQAREFALQVLYLADAARITATDAYLIVSAGSKLDAPSETFARELAFGAERHQKELDEAIAEVAQNWALDRMAIVDRNLLRLASYELLHAPETPVGVVIDEALEIAKVFSSAESSRFINGILDRVRSRRPEGAEPT